MLSSFRGAVMAPPSVKYIIDRSTKIACPKCGTLENPVLFIDRIWLKIDGVVKCSKCGAMIAYIVNTIYTVRSCLSLLQEINKEEDII
jgi:uncharacterized Zn finger protein